MIINQFTTEGLVLREQQIGERDKLVTLLTKTHGLIKAYASGAMTIKSKKGAATSTLVYSSFTIKQKGDNFTISEAAPIKLFFKSSSDIEALALSQYFCELCLTCTPFQESCDEILRLILNSLYFLTEKKMNVFLLKAIFELRLMTIIGYMPNLIACHNCSSYEKDIMFFDTSEGLLYCNSCEDYKSDFAVINLTLLTSLRHIVFSDFKKLFLFQIPDDAAKALSSITERYLINRTEHKLKTLNFFNSLF